MQISQSKSNLTNDGNHVSQHMSFRHHVQSRLEEKAYTIIITTFIITTTTTFTFIIIIIIIIIIIMKYQLKSNVVQDECQCSWLPNGQIQVL